MVTSSLKASQQPWTGCNLLWICFIMCLLKNWIGCNWGRREGSAWGSVKGLWVTHVGPRVPMSHLQLPEVPGNDTSMTPMFLHQDSGTVRLKPTMHEISQSRKCSNTLVLFWVAPLLLGECSSRDYPLCKAEGLFLQSLTGNRLILTLSLRLLKL